jgi:fibronectin type 3 domain-containing protein
VAFNVTASALSTAQAVTLTATANGVSQAAVIQLEGATAQPATQHAVQLSWNAPAPTSDPVVGYHVYRATSGGSNYALLSPSPDTQTSYDDKTVTSGLTYDYIVKSVDSDGVESPGSNMTTVTVP